MVWVLYFTNTALLVRVYIPYTQKWAAQRSAPLRSGEHTMMGEFISFVWRVGYILHRHNVVDRVVYFMNDRYGGANVKALTRAF